MPPMNEANTFSQVIYPYLESIGYQSRDSGFCDEQTFVRKKGGRSGPYDAAFVVDARPVLLVEAKRQGRTLTNETETWLRNCDGDSGLVRSADSSSDNPNSHCCMNAQLG